MNLKSMEQRQVEARQFLEKKAGRSRKINA